MVNTLQKLLIILTSFSGGVIVSAAIISFISIVGLVPRITQKTKTQKYIMHYENMLLLGVLSGGMADLIHFNLPIPAFVVVVFGAAVGIFFGCLAMSLVETLDVIPIFSRRLKLEKGLFFFVLSISLGKFVGSLLYFTLPGFH